MLDQWFLLGDRMGTESDWEGAGGDIRDVVVCSVSLRGTFVVPLPVMPLHR